MSHYTNQAPSLIGPTQNKLNGIFVASYLIMLHLGDLLSFLLLCYMPILFCFVFRVFLFVCFFLMRAKKDVAFAIVNHLGVHRYKLILFKAGESSRTWCPLVLQLMSKHGILRL